MAIPVRNVYHMLCYALGEFRERELVQAGGEESPDSPDKFDLLGLVLADSCRRLLKRGLDRSYREFSEETRSPRGKLDLATTAKRCLRRSARVQCEFEDLSYNVLHNQVLKSSLGRLIRTRGLKSKTISELRDARRRLEGIDEIRLERSHFLRVQLHTNNAHYRFPLKICELVYGNLLPLEEGKGYAFRPLEEDHYFLAALFENFVKAFYEEKFDRVYQVGKEWISWQDESPAGTKTNRLPRMEADLILRDRSRTPRFVIDTKYYPDPMARGRFPGSSQKYQSGHLYQVMTYLQNIYLGENLQEKPAGMLLYAHPGPDKEFVPGNYKLWGFPFRMEAVDLSKPWPEIEDELLALIPQESPAAV